MGSLYARRRNNEMKKTIILFSIFIVSYSHAGNFASAAERMSDDYVIIERKEVLAKQEYTPAQSVSKKYDSYTFFLFPNREWLKDGNNSKLVKELYGEFSYFGKSIGKNNLSVWFVDNDGKVDTARSADYASLFYLDVNSGPYIIFVKPENSSTKDVITANPATGIKEKRMKYSDLRAMVNEKFSDKFIIDMNSIDRRCSVDMLNILNNQLRTENIDTSALNIDKNTCKAKNIFFLSVDKVSSFGKAIIDKIKRIDIEVRGVKIGVELNDLFGSARQGGKS